MKRALLILAGVATLAVVALASAGWLVWMASKGRDRRQPTDRERTLLVTAAAIEGLGIEIGDPGPGESYLVKTNLDGSLEIEYEYDAERSPASRRALWLKSEADIDADAGASAESFRGRISAYRLGTEKIAGNEMRQEFDLIRLGEERFAATVLGEEGPLGTIVVIRQGRIVQSLVLYGLYFSDREQLERLLAPALEAGRSW